METLENLQQIAKIQTGILAKVKETYKDQKTLTDEVLLQLNSAFGPILRPSLELLDKNAITKIKCETMDKSFYRVKGSSEVFYIILPSSWRCSCPAWTQQTWLKNESSTCKHVLAVKLSESMFDPENSSFPYIKENVVNETIFAQMILNMD